MDNYEVNVLTRKGGWKKLPQEVIPNKDELKFNNSDNLKPVLYLFIKLVKLYD